MKAWTTALISLAAAASAHADPAERCRAGIAHAQRGDLPRAALYLEACEQAELAPDLANQAARARTEVARKLEASALSPMSISTAPEGLTAETDALPGERFTTPATIWAKAGTYKITIASDTGTAITVERTLQARSRLSVIINAPTANRAGKAGKVDLRGDMPEQPPPIGPPPGIAHPPMMPKKYLQPAPPSGPELDDPFAPRRDDAVPRWRLGARVAAGVFDHAGAAARFGVGVAVIAARRIDGPVMFASRLDWSHRGIDRFGVNVGAAVVLLERRSFALWAGGALRGVVHAQDTLDAMPLARVAVGAALDLDLALLRLPIATAVRFEQDFTELVPGAHDRAVLLELGYDWR